MGRALGGFARRTASSAFNMNSVKPRLALVSIGIRRDLLAPLAFFSKLELAHFFKQNVYNDLTAEDFGSTLHTYTSPLNLYQQLVRAQPAVIQSVEPFSYYTQPYLWACFAAARKTRAALLVPTFENRPLDVKFGKLRARCLRYALRMYFARACLILVLNDGARKNVLTCGITPKKIIRAMWGSWGVDPREFFPRATREENQPPTILFVGRLHEEKGVFILLETFARVQAEIPNARLYFIGDGPARAILQAQVQSRALTQAVTLVGSVTNRAIPDWMRRADVFCAPSLTTRKWAEQVGMSALQAMASGVPIVSTRSGAIPEYIPDGVAGLLVPENDAPALADAILQVMSSHPLAQALGARGRAYAVSHYDARANVENCQELVLEHCVK